MHVLILAIKLLTMYAPVPPKLHNSVINVLLVMSNIVICVKLPMFVRLVKLHLYLLLEVLADAQQIIYKIKILAHVLLHLLFPAVVVDAQQLINNLERLAFAQQAQLNTTQYVIHAWQTATNVNRITYVLNVPQLSFLKIVANPVLALIRPS